MTTRTHFTFRIDKLDANGEILEHIAGLEDFDLQALAERADHSAEGRAGSQRQSEDAAHLAAVQPGFKPPSIRRVEPAD
jgi:hypothetical protein